MVKEFLDMFSCSDTIPQSSRQVNIHRDDLWRTLKVARKHKIQ